MWKPLNLATVVLLGVAAAFAWLIAKELRTAPRLPVARPQPAASVAAAPAAAPSAPPAPAANYSIIASRNLFSPTRSDAPPAPPAPATPPVALPKPSLYGVVLQDGTPVAYLEDPSTKRVARYRVGDAIAGGTVQKIESDTVTLVRPDGPVAVRLHDPTKPRSATPVTPAATQPAGAPGRPLGAGTLTPGVPTYVPSQGGAPSRRATTRIPPRPADAPQPE